jgi:hypothetical protein
MAKFFLSSLYVMGLHGALVDAEEQAEHLVILNVGCPICGLEYFTVIEPRVQDRHIEAKQERAQVQLACECSDHGHRFQVVR